MSLRHLARFLNPKREFTLNTVRDFMCCDSLSYKKDSLKRRRELAYSKTDDEMKLIVTLNDLDFYVRNSMISETLLKMNMVQLNELIKQFSTMSGSTETAALTESETVQIYMCYSVCYPECASALTTYDDDQNTRAFKIHILDSNHTVEQKKRYLDLADHLLYDIDIFDLYASLADQSEYDELAHLATPFESLYYDVCCGRDPGTFYNYLKIIFSAPREKRILIADYILQSGYKSLYVAQNMCEYFSTLSPYNMKFRFCRAKRLWGDEYIDVSHRFERLFIDLLKIDDEPCEVEIAIMAISDMSCRQDIDYCYWSEDSLDCCNEMTRHRLAGYIDACDHDLSDDDYDNVGTEFETSFFKRKNNRELKKKNNRRHNRKICNMQT
jgi:hypothetical protein